MMAIQKRLVDERRRAGIGRKDRKKDFIDKLDRQQRKFGDGSLELYAKQAMLNPKDPLRVYFKLHFKADATPDDLQDMLERFIGRPVDKKPVDRAYNDFITAMDTLCMDRAKSAACRPLPEYPAATAWICRFYKTARFLYRRFDHKNIF